MSETFSEFNTQHVACGRFPFGNTLAHALGVNTLQLLIRERPDVPFYTTAEKFLGCATGST